MHRVLSFVVILAIGLAGVALVSPELPSAAVGEIKLAELMPLSTWEKQFKITEGKDRGKVVPLVFENDPSRDEGWRLIFGDYASLVIRKDASGALLMERLDLLIARSYIVYEPPLPMLPRGFGSGASIRRHADFKMYGSEDGKLKRAGRVTHLVKQISSSRFDTPAGLIDGYNVEIEHGMQMQYARLSVALRLGYRRDDGPVYGAGRYTFRMLGVFSETRSAAAGLVQN